MIALKNVLVPTDFGEAAASALNYGRDLARQYGAALHVLYVADDVNARYALDSAPMFLPDVQKEIEEDAKKRAASLLSDEDRAQLKARVAVCTSVSPAAVIVDYARTHAIDLIVMGTHGRLAMSHLLLGSIAEKVVRSAPCPVLTVRHPEREFIVPDALATVARV
jgi:nucleotide-binding universal stress UspA family protein